MGEKLYSLVWVNIDLERTVMKPQKLRTPQEVQAEWLHNGMTQADWARARGFNRATVNQVMSGKNAATQGVGHKIAVLLGIKDGVIDTEH